MIDEFKKLSGNDSIEFSTLNFSVLMDLPYKRKRILKKLLLKKYLQMLSAAFKKLIKSNTIFQKRFHQ